MEKRLEVSLKITAAIKEKRYDLIPQLAEEYNKCLEEEDGKGFDTSNKMWDKKFGIVTDVDILLLLASPRGVCSTIIGVLQKGDVVEITNCCLNKKDDLYLGVHIDGMDGYVRRRFIQEMEAL